MSGSDTLSESGEIMKAMVAVACLVIALVWTCGVARGQDAAPAEAGDAGGVALPGAIYIAPAPPQTKLESIENRTGTVIMRGTKLIGAINGSAGSGIRISAIELDDSAKGDKAAGLRIAVFDQRGRRETNCYVDADEIEPLLAGIDAIARLDRGSTRLQDSEAFYRTRGGFEIAGVITGGARQVRIGAYLIAQNGYRYPAAGTAVDVSRLDEIRERIVLARKALEQPAEVK